MSETVKADAPIDHLVTQDQHMALAQTVSDLADKVKELADGAANVSGNADMAKVAAFIDAYEPMLKQLASVANAAAPEGHSPASIIATVGQKLLGLFHLNPVQAVGPLAQIPSSAMDEATAGKA